MVLRSTTACIVIVLFTMVSVTCSCVIGCKCSSDVISCSQLTSFPRPFKSNAVRVALFMSHFPEIPPNAFEGVPNVQFIHFQQVKIGSIYPCAFSELGPNVGIFIDLTEIGTIKGGAFGDIHTNVNNQNELSISSSTIGRIESFAFDSIQGLQLLQIHSTDIELIQHYAFYNLTDIESIHVFDTNITVMERNAFDGLSRVRSMDIHHVTFGELACNTLDLLRAELGRNFSFHSLDVKCDCSVAWLYEAGNANSGVVLDDVICYEPGKFKYLHLKNISRSELCSGRLSPCDFPPQRRPSCSLPAASASPCWVSNMAAMAEICAVAIVGRGLLAP